MKVYAVLYDYTYDGDEHDAGVVGVYSSLARAKQMFDIYMLDERNINKQRGYDKYEENENKYKSWLDGFYNDDHSVVAIQEFELDK